MSKREIHIKKKGMVHKKGRNTDKKSLRQVFKKCTYKKEEIYIKKL